jgi:hypothetical protein
MSWYLKLVASGAFHLLKHLLPFPRTKQVGKAVIVSQPLSSPPSIPTWLFLAAGITKNGAQNGRFRSKPHPRRSQLGLKQQQPAA